MIVRNSARCLACLDEVESTHRHDFKSCKCGNVFVDGGKDYLRRGCRTSAYEDTSIITEDDQ